MYQNKHKTEPDIVVEKHSVLRYDPNDLAQWLLSDLAYVLSIKPDVTGVHVVKTEQQSNDGALATARRPN